MNLNSAENANGYASLLNKIYYFIWRKGKQIQNVAAGTSEISFSTPLKKIKILKIYKIRKVVARRKRADRP